VAVVAVAVAEEAADMTGTVAEAAAGDTNPHLQKLLPSSKNQTLSVRLKALSRQQA
jgi:hypothetical protein